MKLFVRTFLLASVVCASQANAATVSSTSCSQAAVLTAISSSTDGDTVTVPAGSCAWTSTTTVSKNIVLQGAGVDQTIISRAGLVLDVRGSSSTHSSRVTGFTFNGAVRFNAPTNASAWFRFDHNKVVRGNESIGIYDNHISGTERILIDHNQLIHTGTSEIRFWIFDGETGADPAVWRQDSAVGTARNVFIEDNTIQNLNVKSGNEMFFQIWWAGRVVLRHNTIHNFSIDAHDYRDNSQRGARSWEIYENTWTNASGVDLQWMNLRAGTGVVYNNILTETSQLHAIGLLAYSAYGYVSPCCCMPQGYPYCMDQIGRGKFTGTKTPGDVSLAADCKNNRANWSQALEPAYFWNNTRNGIASTPSVGGGSGCAAECGVTQSEAAAIQLNRDYYTSAKPGYTPFTYPHPLTTAVPPQPPLRPRIVQP